METFHFIDNDTNKPACGAPASSQTKVPGKAKSCTSCTKVLKSRRSA